jgi:acyl-coenzyme A synthetase/AMP-(fatty) acid ligase
LDNDGDIMLVGRIDHQVKIQGYRIELGEIEFHARELLKGQNAVACSFENQMGNTEIALFAEGKLNDEDYLIKYLSGKMPYYMVPTKIVVVDSFPINTSGKVDRIKLKNNLLSQL